MRAAVEYVLYRALIEGVITSTAQNISCASIDRILVVCPSVHQSVTEVTGSDSTLQHMRLYFKYQKLE